MLLDNGVTLVTIISRNGWFVVTAGKKIKPGIVHLWFNCLVAFFFKAIGLYFSREAKERHAPVIHAFTPASSLSLRMITSVCQSIHALP